MCQREAKHIHNCEDATLWKGQHLCHEKSLHIKNSSFHSGHIGRSHPFQCIMNTKHHTSAIDLNARMEDSNTQRRCIFIDPVLEKRGEDRLRSINGTETHILGWLCIYLNKDFVSHLILNAGTTKR